MLPFTAIKTATSILTITRDFFQPSSNYLKAINICLIIQLDNLSEEAKTNVTTTSTIWNKYFWFFIANI